jgi:cysteine desulfurase
MRTIYLDYNTTTPLAGASRQAMLPFLDEHFASPGNPHWQSRAVEESIEDARASVASMIGSVASEIVFTSGGTESNNLALLGAARAFESRQKRRVKQHIVTSTLEHGPVALAADALERNGWEVTRVECNREGFIDPDSVRKAIRKSTRLISIQFANAQLGTVQDIASLTRLSRPKNCLFHTDATQAFGKIEVDIDELGIDLLSISGHKMYAPKGIGALYVRSGVLIESLLFGGWEEAGLRPGMNNGLAIAGFGAAAQLVKAGKQESTERLLEQKDRFLQHLEENLGDSIRMIGRDTKTLPNTCCLQMGGVSAQAILAKASELHIGLPIANQSISENAFRMHALNAIQLTLEEARSVLSVSVGWNTTRDEVDDAASVLSEAYRSLSGT